MGIDGSGLVTLGAPDDDAVFSHFLDSDKEISVGLLMRRFAPVSFGIRHRPVHDQILILYIDQKLLEVLVVMGAVFFINFISRRIDRVKGIHSHTPLKAGACLLTEKPLHLDLFLQILRILVDMRKAVDFSSCQM